MPRLLQTQHVDQAWNVWPVGLISADVPERDLAGAANDKVGPALKWVALCPRRDARADVVQRVMQQHFWLIDTQP